VVSFTLRLIYLQERAPGTYCSVGWMGSKAVLDEVVKRKNPSLHCRESNSDRLARSTVTVLTELQIDNIK